MRSGVRTFSALVLAACLSLGSAPARAANGWELFTHPDLGFSLRYPAGWVATPLSQKDIPLVVVGPPAAGVPEVHLGVAVFVVRAPANVTADDLVAAADRQLREELGKYRVLRIDRTKLGGTPAVVIYLIGRGHEEELYGLVLFTIIKSRLYAVIGFTALNSTQLADETRLLQSILVTFRPR